MATTNVNSSDSPSAVDGESKMESEKSDHLACGPQNDCNNDGTTSGDTESIDPSLPSGLAAKTNQCTKRKAHCSWTKALIATLLITTVLLASTTAGLGVHVSKISERMDRLEAQFNSRLTTLLVNKTQLNLELGDSDDVPEQIFNLSKEIEGFKDRMSMVMYVIQTLQTTHEKDMDQIRMNVSTMLIQINTSLSSSLLHFANKAVANLSELNEDIQRELSGVRNHSLVLTQNVSALTDQVLHLERRSDEHKTNTSALESSTNERLSRLMANVSSNKELLRDVSATQAEHTTTIGQMKRNISLAEDRLELQLSDVTEHLMATLLDLNGSLSQIDSNHRAYLRNLSSDLNDLNSDLMATKVVFFANTSALREELIELSVDVDNANDNLTDLASLQKRLLLDLADVKEIHSGNISAIGQSLVHQNEELGRTNKRLENLSSIQDGLQRDLGLTNEALQSNLSALEQRFMGEVNRTEVQLQNQQTELWLTFGATRDRLEANISALQETHGLLQGDLGHTKDKLRILSSQHIDLQSDYNVTKQAFYTIKAAIEWNMTQLHTLIHNHSSVLGEHSRLFGDAAQSRSMLSDRIDETSNSVSSHDRLISRIKSNVTVVQNSVTGLHGTLTTNVNNLNTRINDHVDWIQHSLADQSQRFANFDSRIRDVEQELASDAVCVAPLGLLLLSAIALLVCYVTL